jgi:predicted DNA-binding transcriptional regulator AlpA
MKNALQAEWPADDSIIREPELKRLLGCSHMTIRRMEGAGNFPKRFKLNPVTGRFGGVGWSRREVLTWLEARRASRQAA